MELTGARVLVAGATGALGEALARALVGEGCRVALGGRDEGRLVRLAEELDVPCARFDAADPASCAAAVDRAHFELGGLDGLVVTTGAVAFGHVTEVDDETALAVVQANLLGPIALVRRGLQLLDDDGVVVGFSAVVADAPTAGMAVYSAAKAGLSAFLAAARRENRTRGVRVLDVRPPHLDTGFSDRALAGEPPRLPEPFSADRIVEAVVAGLRDGRREIAWDLQERALVVR